MRPLRLVAYMVIRELMFLLAKYFSVLCQSHGIHLHSGSLNHYEVSSDHLCDGISLLSVTFHCLPEFSFDCLYIHVYVIVKSLEYLTT